MKRFLTFLIVLCCLSCGSALADIHIIYDPTDLVIPNGEVSGELYDSMSWLGSSAAYGSGSQYIGDSPESGSLLYDTKDDDVGPLYAASEVGISEEDIFYAKGHAEASISTNPMWGYPIWTIARGDGGVWFNIDNEPLILHWIAWGFEGYDDTGWTPTIYDTGWAIALHKLTFTPEGTLLDLVYATNSGLVSWPEATELFYLDPESTYQLTWSLSAKCSTVGDHGWANLNIDLANPVPVPGAFLLGIIGIGTAGIKLSRKTKQ